MPRLHTIRVDNTLFMFDEGSRAQVETKVNAALRKGATVTWEDKSVQWITVNHRINAQERGSAVYTWDRKGEKVLADIVLMTKYPIGKIKAEVIGTRYVEL